MSSKARRLAALLAIAASAAAFTGCRNPFLPSADIQISNITFPGVTSGAGTATEMVVYSSITPDYYSYRVSVDFLSLNKVEVNLTSVNIFYTDLSGNPVTAYSTSGGRTIKLMNRLYPLTSNDPNGNPTTITLLALDTRVYQELQSPTLLPKYIICTMTFRGEDENGYDVKLTGQFTIKGFGF